MSDWYIRPPRDPALHAKLDLHPKFILSGESADGIHFWRGDWNRQLLIGVPGGEAINGPLYGLIELADNNPLVCADAFSIPSPEATLALIGLGPLARSGVILDDPVVRLSFEPTATDVQSALHLLGWTGGCVVSGDPQDLGSVRAAVCMAEIPNLGDLSMIDGIYEEAYSRSFFVRSAQDQPWDAELVRGFDHAAYQLRVSVAEDRWLVTVLVMSDQDGKIGAGQAVHALNVMCGFEEHLGLSD